jgi:hypothetical protein
MGCGYSSSGGYRSIPAPRVEEPPMTWTQLFGLLLAMIIGFIVYYVTGLGHVAPPPPSSYSSEARKQ